MTKRRVLYLLFHYPSITEAYVESEIRAVSDRYEVLVVATDVDPPGVTPYRAHSPFRVISDRNEILRFIREFQPHVIHAHRLFMLPLMSSLCAEANIPFTVRSHAHDAIPSSDPRVTRWMAQAPTVLAATTISQLCLGVLAFPFTRIHLETWGVPADKIFDCFPVVDFQRFQHPSVNGDGIMNTGSYMPKKRMEEFLELGQMMPHRTFRLYALSSRYHPIERLKALNQQMGNPVCIMDPVQPEDMPREYKKAQWMVYTADPGLANVGWPVSIAEAQAAGVGVCMANIRPDLAEYVGKAGHLFHSISEVPKIISQPFDDERRKLGFALARRSDIFQHRQVLLARWDSA